MASIRRKPSSGWEARYRDAEGTMHARTFPTKTAASRWSKEMETDLSRGDWIDPRLGRTTFGRWAQDYLTTIVHLRVVTRGDYERQLRVHILPVFAEQAVAHITPVDVRRFIAELRATGMAPKTLQKVRLVLRQVLETARSSGAIRANPCDGIRLPRAEAKEPRFLAADEVEALARATRPPYGLVVRFAAATGLRPSELCGLRVGRLNLVKGTVEVAEALTVVAGRTEVGPIKNGVRRSVQITRTLCDQLGLHLAARAATLARPLAADDFVFVAPEGGPLRRDLLHKRIFQPAVEAAGLPTGLRVHDRRHTCASLLIDLGAHPKVIQEWLGHKSITVTIDVYGHLFPSLNEALAERLEEVFRRAAQRTGSSDRRGAGDEPYAARPAVTTDPTHLEAGALFEWHVVVEGVPIELLAEVEVSGATLHLRDVAVFPVGVEHADVGLSPLVRAARSTLFPELRAAGFSRLRVTGTRLSGASPGRIVDLTIDLERQAR